MNDEIVDGILSAAYDNATQYRSGEHGIHMQYEVKEALNEILGLAESAKGVMTVLLTSTVYTSNEAFEAVEIKFNRPILSM